MEKALTLDLHEQQLLSILHLPKLASQTAVLIVVGGPQYRVGSHRQFIQLSRALASQGIASLRFDYRGMGDSEGQKQPFDAICDDLKEACDALAMQDGIKNIVIWGLCDAASAAMIYSHQDPRIVGLILLNPWLKSEQAKGKTMLKHYYLQRLMTKEFWLKMLRGNINVKSSLGDVASFTQDSMTKQNVAETSYQKRMQKGISFFKGKVCLILSGVDLTAKEFEQQTSGNKDWQRLKANNVEVHRIAKADHTFSSSEFKLAVEAISKDFILKLN